MYVSSWIFMQIEKEKVLKIFAKYKTFEHFSMLRYIIQPYIIEPLIRYIIQ